MIKEIIWYDQGEVTFDDTEGEYKNNFVVSVRNYLIKQLESKKITLNKVLEEGAKLCIEISNVEKEKLISENLKACLEYLDEASENGNVIDFDIDSIIYFTFDNISEEMKYYIERGLVSEKYYDYI